MEWVRLGDVALKITKGTTPTSVGFDFVEKGINFVKVESISESGSFIENKFDHINEECNQKLLRSQLKENDILFSIAGAIGRTAIVRKEILPANTNQALAIIRVPPDVFDYSFLMYALQSPVIVEQYEKQKQGVAQINLSLQNIRDFRIPKLRLEEQRRIAAILDKVTDLIAKRRAQLDKLDLMVKSRFVEMFGNPGTNKKGSELTSLGSVCQINPKKGKDQRLVSGLHVSFVPMTAVTETGEIDVSETRLYDDVKTGFTYFAENDVLFAKITPCMENGKGAIAKGLCNGIGFGSTEFHVLRPISGKTNPYWIYTLTSFANFRLDAASNMTGSAGQRRVSASFLENYKVPLPPIEEQNQFELFVQKCIYAKTDITRSLQKAELLKSALMQQYFG